MLGRDLPTTAVEVLGLTCPGRETNRWEASTLEKSHSNRLLIAIRNIHMSARPVENARDNFKKSNRLISSLLNLILPSETTFKKLPAFPSLSLTSLCVAVIVLPFLVDE